MKLYVSDAWAPLLRERGLDSLDAFWELELPAVDAPNTGRGKGGISEVCRMVLTVNEGEEKVLMVKRQQNYFSRTLLHPIRGIPTFEKEVINALRYKKLNIPAIEPVFFERIHHPQGERAVLVTEFLDGYISMDELVNEWLETGWPSHEQRRRIIKAVAHGVRKIHQGGLMHNCLYPKHIFVKDTGEEVRVRFIDLEKNKWFPLGSRRVIKDLSTLNRRSLHWGRTDRLRFLMHYLGSDLKNSRFRKLLLKIVRKTRK
jgi:tRNA A-37 threonylcarbamoyl transferase component Bud32